MGEKEEEQQNAKKTPMPGDLLEPKEELLSEEEEEEEEDEDDEENGEQDEHEDHEPEEDEPNGNELELPQREQRKHKQKQKQRAPNESQQAADDATATAAPTTATTAATAQAASVASTAATVAAAEELQRPGDADAVGNANGHSLASSDGDASGKFDFNLHILLPFAKRYMRYELPAVGLLSLPFPSLTCHHRYTELCSACALIRVAASSSSSSSWSSSWGISHGAFTCPANNSRQSHK